TVGLPCCTRIGALQELHIRKKIAKMLGVPSAASALLHPTILWSHQRCPRQDIVHTYHPSITQRRRIHEHPIGGRRLEQLASKGPQRVDGRLRTTMTFLGAVAETDQP